MAEKAAVTAVRVATMVCAIGIIASMGGYEQGMLGLAGMLGRMAIFALIIGRCTVAQNVTAQRKRARRVAARKAQITTNIK